MNTKLFKFIHDKPIEIYLMWLILLVTIIVLFSSCIATIFCNKNYRESVKFVYSL